jgi:hypothetical protein
MTGLLGLLTSELATYVGGAIIALLALFGYGKMRERAGAKAERERRRLQDLTTASETEEKLHEALRGDSDRSAVERLREQGRLRD